MLYHYHMYKNSLTSLLISQYVQSVLKFHLFRRLFFSFFDSGSKQGPYIVLIALLNLSVVLLPWFSLPLLGEKTESLVLENLFPVYILLLSPPWCFIFLVNLWLELEALWDRLKRFGKSLRHIQCCVSLSGGIWFLVVPPLYFENYSSGDKLKWIHMEQYWCIF